MSSEFPMLEKFALDMSGYPAWLAEHTNTDEPYPFVSRERAVSEFRQYVWQNWREREGICGECPYSCQENRWQPDFGAFSFDADIMLLGQDPGGGNQGDGNREPNTGRSDDEIPMLVSQRGYTQEWNQKWPYDGVGAGDGDTSWGNRNTLVPAITHALSSWQGEFDIDDIYYTNAKKCPTLEVDTDSKEHQKVWEDTPFSVEDVNSKAYEQCESYLEQEISLVDPDVIIALGQRAWKAAGSVLSRGLPEVDNFSTYRGVYDEKSIVRSDNERPSIVLSGFPGYAGEDHLKTVFEVAEDLLQS